jgi:hypothetical protein
MFIPIEDFRERWTQVQLPFTEELYKTYIDFFNTDTLLFNLDLTLVMYSQITKVAIYDIKSVMKTIADIHVHYFYPKYRDKNLDEVKLVVEKAWI